jgi:hypothetical protein
MHFMLFGAFKIDLMAGWMGELDFYVIFMLYHRVLSDLIARFYSQNVFQNRLKTIFKHF